MGQMNVRLADDIFDALADVHRRRVLTSLLDHNPQTVETMSEECREMDTMSAGLLTEYLTGNVEIDGVDKTQLQMYNVHLPKLADYGFITWDREEEKVRKGPRFDELRPLLVLLESNREVRPDDWV